MATYICLFFLLGLTTYTASGCLDHVQKAWSGGRSGHVFVDAANNDEIEITFSKKLRSAEFYCMQLLSDDGLTYQYRVHAWCPHVSTGLKLQYSLYYSSEEASDIPSITRISVNNKLVCNDTNIKVKQGSGEDADDCSKNVHVSGKKIPGNQAGSITMTTTKDLYNWKVVVGFSEDVTGFNINEGQPDPSAKDPCAKINTHKSFLFNANMTAGEITMKYYMTYEHGKAEPKIVYINLHDEKNSYKCGTKPKCP